ncbi:class I lanthipeptide [Pedobacter sp. WC2423]|uniref:class I lanthipeptide n=1 Tax=Pedobacter sp. WC2423 TaxID=3234142 RepID=UPI003465C5AA
MKNENIKNSKLTLKKVTIVELSQEDLALVTGGVKAESQLLTTSHFSCTGSLCCATEVPTEH